MGLDIFFWLSDLICLFVWGNIIYSRHQDYRHCHLDAGNQIIEDRQGHCLYTHLGVDSSCCTYRLHHLTGKYKAGECEWKQDLEEAGETPGQAGRLWVQKALATCDNSTEDWWHQYCNWTQEICRSYLNTKCLSNLEKDVMTLCVSL